MPFIETPRFPDRISANAQRKRITNTQIVTLASGVEITNRNWAQKLRQFDIGAAVRTPLDSDLIVQWFEALDGPADAFRFKDWGDFQVATSNGLLQPVNGGVRVGTAGAGFGVPTYQLIKRYSVGAKNHDRDIRKPVAGTVVARRDAANITVGASAGNIAIDTTTGLITFVADQTRSATGHTAGASHVFTLSSAFSPNLVVGGRLWLTGVTGTAAALLNSTPLQITAVASNLVTVAVNTTGLTATGGTASFFPQPANVLDWSGQFDVPVRFASDELDDVVLQFRDGQVLTEASSILLREIRT
jgi:uncharacterized protein (TIGR02217 family)